MAKYMRFPFGVTGTRSTVPDPSQPSGAVSWQEGWPVDYQLDPDTEPTAKLIDRAQTNETFYQISLCIQQYQQFGVPDFITSADNGGTPFSYSQFARVRYDPGTGTKVYESLVDSNTALPSDATKWAQVAASSGSGIPAGFQGPYGGNTAPDGWLLCAGQAISRVTYAALFAAIGTNYGIGDGINTFNVPDKRGRTSVGKDDMGGTPANRITNAVAGFVGTQIGAAGGSQNVQQHTHTAVVTDPGHTHNSAASWGAAGLNPGGQAVTWASGNPGNYNVISATTGISVANSNFGTGTSGNVQPSQVDNWIIKT